MLEINFKNINFCQSCAMPMNDEDFGTEKDGSKSSDYSKYCYQNGEFTSDVSMEEMIDFCVPKTAQVICMDEKEARMMSEEIFPKLKRWKR